METFSQALSPVMSHVRTVSYLQILSWIQHQQHENSHILNYSNEKGNSIDILSFLCHIKLEIS